MKVPRDGDRLLALPLDEIHLATVDERGSLSVEDFDSPHEQVNVDALGFMVPDQLTMFSRLRCSVLTLPREALRGKEAIFVTVILVQSALFERHKKTHVVL